MFSVLKEIEKGYTPHQDDFGITKEQYGAIIEIMLDCKLIKGAKVKRAGRGHLVVSVFTSQAKIDVGGFKFLEENTNWNKVYKGLKEIRDWFPGY